MWKCYGYTDIYKVPEPELCRLIHIHLNYKITTKLKWEAKTMSWNIYLQQADSKRCSTYNYYEDYACAPDETELLVMIEGVLPTGSFLSENENETLVVKESKILTMVQNGQRKANTLARLYLQIVKL